MSNLLDQLRAQLAHRYTIERELGRGGMARVYVAVDKRHNRQVAIKVFPPELAAAIGPARFKREIAITSRLVHPHILALHDSGEAAGGLYYVMPLVQGESLRARIDREPTGLPIDEVISIAQQVAGALSHAHRLGVVHRDVKPDNILLADGHALLADFGIARLLEPGDTITETGVPLGTPMYRSPEQAAGHTDVDGRSDIYSLGCVMYESIGGVKARDILSNRFTKKVPPLRELRIDTPATVVAAIARATMSNPDDRFATAADFATALKSPARAVHRRRISGITKQAAIAVAALLIVAATAFTIRRSRVSPLAPKRVLVSHFENRTGDRSLDVLGEMAEDYIARGLAETRLVEVIDARAVNNAPAPPRPVTAASTRDLAQSLGAATTVGGNYYRTGDTLYFESQILDAKSGKLIVSTPPALGPISDRMHVVELLRQRIMTSFGVIFGPDFNSWRAQSIPPSYAAYQEVLAGNEAVWKTTMAEALLHFQRAAAIDPTYAGAKTSMVLAAAIGRQCRIADSVAKILEPTIARLAPVDRGQLKWGVARCKGDWQGSLEAGREVLAAAPRSLSFSVLHAITALELFRPKEAIAVLSSVDPRRMAPTPAHRALYSFTALAYRESGDSRKELEIIRDGLRVFPDDERLRNAELGALVALGKVNDALQKRDAWFKRPDLFTRTEWNPAQVNLCLSMELRSNGHPDVAQAVLRDAGQWYRDNPAVSELNPRPLPCNHWLLTTSYYLGQWDRARALYQRVLATDSLSRIAYEALGAIAARQGNFDEARRMDEWLATHSDREIGRATYARARIAALLGDRDNAVALLRKAFAEGLNNRMKIYLDPDLSSLRDLPAYRELFELRG